MATKSDRLYPLRKSRHIMKWVYAWYKKKGKQLNQPQLETLETDLMALDGALIAQNKEEASLVAHRVEKFGDSHCHKGIFEYAWELVIALIFALVIAVIVRQMWFEPYEIPTGSMRPTFKEQDHLIVTKTAFGINSPLETRHLYFDPALVQRTSVLIFSGDGLPLSDVTTTYFGIFPYTKRYIKRCMGKPGDSLYFYGGRIFGVDSQGNDLKELRDSPWIQPLEHIPYLSFEGEYAQHSKNSILLRQMHLPAGKLKFSPTGQLTSEVFNGKEWVKDQPQAQATPHNTIQTYSDILGMRNFAMARLLTKEELKKFQEGSEDIGEGVLYLQLHHTPSLSFPKPFITGGGYVGIPAYSTVIPLKQQHLDAIIQNIYTARFVVENGKGRRYGLGERHFSSGSPSFENVPNGTYEFYYGKASSIHWGGIATEVAEDSPLYSHSPTNIQKLYNLGIEFDTSYSPHANNMTHFPHRYAYFRDGDLYLMGAPILKKDDPTLIAFHKREQERQEKATVRAPYVAFKDYGPPLKEDGTLDIDFIKTFGMTLPEGQYLVLGDNHAMSADSRVFGFVPENNLQGAPCWIIWPPGDRLGAPPQKPYPFMNVPRAIVWTIFGVIMITWYGWHRRSIRRPIFKKIS